MTYFETVYLCFQCLPLQDAKVDHEMGSHKPTHPLQA